MATYAAYRHIELDNVGYSKKRVRNPPSDIFGGSASPMPRSPGSQTPYGSNITPLREQRSCQQRLSDSFTRLFGPDSPSAPAQPAKVERRSSLGRNPVTGDGVQSWDSPRSASRATTPRILRNPVTGEGLSGPASNVSSPAKPMSNGHVGAILNGTA